VKKFLNVAALFGLLILTPIILLTHNTSAQESSDVKESITLSPAVSRPTVNAGEQISGKLTIINDGQTDYQFLTYARPYSVSSENYDPNYTEVNERTEAYQWVQFSKTEADLVSGGNTEISYVVNVPKDASPGGHYAVLFAETQPPKAVGSQVVRKKRVGSLIYITVNGNYKKSGSLANWGATFWQPKKPLAANLKIKNDGNVHFQVDSTVNFKNIFGKTRMQLNQQHLVLPGTTRKLPVTWERAPYIGIYKIDGSVKFLDKQQDLPTKWAVILPVPVLIAIGGIVVLAVLYKVIKMKKTPKKTRSV
jgi:hypothetical protein